MIGNAVLSLSNYTRSFRTPVSFHVDYNDITEVCCVCQNVGVEKKNHLMSTKTSEARMCVHGSYDIMYSRIFNPLYYVG